jgi:predicted glycoside hydrolase/deacetylase ChbG (UPF0249 family)
VNTVILCADDYAMTEGISRGIEELAGAGRISATSAMVTTRHWPQHAARVGGLRRNIAVGLHLNFTLGQPLGPVPSLTGGGALPGLSAVIRSGLAGRLDPREIEAETCRQFERFRGLAGCDPDFVDGHQHVHALPGVRTGVLRGLGAACPDRRIWLRDPGDHPQAIIARGAAVAKSLALAALTFGFGREARLFGFATNRGFSGVSAFDRAGSYDREMRRFLSYPGPAHLIMCHPGYVDDELRGLDPVVERREDERAALMRLEGPRLVRSPFDAAIGPQAVAS